LARLWRAAEIRRRLRAAIAGLEQASEQDPHGVVLLTADQRIEFASPPAHRLCVNTSLRRAAQSCQRRSSTCWKQVLARSSGISVTAS
jgi:hypothetical protein